MKSKNTPLFISNARIFGGEGWDEPVWFEAALIRNGIITGLGTNAEIRRVVGGYAQEFNLDGALVLPGLCDAHLHLAAGGQSLTIPDLSGKNYDGVRKILLDAAQKTNPGEGWLEAFNWDSNVCRLNADILDGIIIHRPVVVHQRDLHCCCCNRQAMQLAQIHNPTQDSPSGCIGRFDDGRPNGLFYESAVDLILKARPESSPSERKSFILNGIAYLKSLGLTAISEVLDHGNEEVYRELDDSGQLDIDIDAWRRVEDWNGASPPYVDGGRFKVQTLKLFLDGSFGSRTAALFEPYLDKPDAKGMTLYSDAQLADICKEAVRCGWRLAMHAIGDRAVDQACRILAGTSKVNNVPHRIEHIQLLPPNGIELLRKSDAVMSIQPVHLLDDRKWLVDGIGAERCRQTFIWRSALEAGVQLAAGSDWPVARPDPLLNLQALMHRADYSGESHPAFDATQTLTSTQSIRALSYGYAVASGWTKRRGSITPGLQADLTVIENYSPDLNDWANARVKITITQGRIVFQR